MFYVNLIKSKATYYVVTVVNILHKTELIIDQMSFGLINYFLPHYNRLFNINCWLIPFNGNKSFYRKIYTNNNSVKFTYNILHCVGFYTFLFVFMPQLTCFSHIGAIVCLRGLNQH